MTSARPTGLFATSRFDAPCFHYFHGVLTRTLLHEPSDLSVLVVNIDGGTLPLMLSNAGYRVALIEVDEGSPAHTEARCSDAGSSVLWQPARERRLPYQASSFDVVVLHGYPGRKTLAIVLDESYRLLKFGGVLLFHAINRTVWSRVALNALDSGRSGVQASCNTPAGRRATLAPTELLGELERRGIETYRTRGIALPIRAIPRALGRFVLRKVGRSLPGELTLRESRSLRLAFMGWGVKFG